MFSFKEPILRQTSLDKSVFEQGSSSSAKVQFKMPEPATANNLRPTTPDSNSSANPSNPGSQPDDNKGENYGDIYRALIIHWIVLNGTLHYLKLRLK